MQDVADARQVSLPLAALLLANHVLLGRRVVNATSALLGSTVRQVILMPALVMLARQGISNLTMDKLHVCLASQADISPKHLNESVLLAA